MWSLIFLRCTALAASLFVRVSAKGLRAGAAEEKGQALSTREAATKSLVMHKYGDTSRRLRNLEAENLLIPGWELNIEQFVVSSFTLEDDQGGFDAAELPLANTAVETLVYPLENDSLLTLELPPAESTLEQPETDEVPPEIPEGGEVGGDEWDLEELP